jgi:hypothetical protein
LFNIPILHVSFIKNIPQKCWGNLENRIQYRKSRTSVSIRSWKCTALEAWEVKTFKKKLEQIWPFSNSKVLKAQVCPSAINIWSHFLRLALSLNGVFQLVVTFSLSCVAVWMMIHWTPYHFYVHILSIQIQNSNRRSNFL